jgi:hypothetical protein
MNDPAYEPLIQAAALSEVRFVHDYVQFVFWPYGLSVYAKVSVSTNGRVLGPRDAGYFDSIYILIGQKLVAVARTEGVELEFEFSGGTSLLVSLRLEEAVGPEVAMLSNENGGHLMVERYGE